MVFRYPAVANISIYLATTLIQIKNIIIIKIKNNNMFTYIRYFNFICLIIYVFHIFCDQSQI